MLYFFIIMNNKNKHKEANMLDIIKFLLFIVCPSVTSEYEL